MALEWQSDEELFALARRELFTAVVGDCMDKLGLLHQFLPPQIRPLDPSMVTIGRAMTVLGADCLEPLDPPKRRNPVLEKPFGLMLDALDDLKPNEVYVNAGGSPTYSVWGELMSTRAMQCGCVGAVMNTYARDTTGILALKFPTFCWGSWAQDSAPRSKVVDFRVPLEVEGVTIRPGDIVFGDVDGVCVVPRLAEEEILTNALAKARGEKLVGTAIQKGMTAKAAFEKYGIM